MHGPLNVKLYVYLKEHINLYHIHTKSVQNHTVYHYLPIIDHICYFQ